MGFRNYKYFVLLLVYSGLSLMFIVFTYWEEVSLALTNDNFTAAYVYVVFLEFLLALFLGAILSGFACLHLWYVSPSHEKP